MKRNPIVRAAAFAAIALTFAACYKPQETAAVFDPRVAQQLFAARIDHDRALTGKVKHALAEDVGPGVYGIEVTTDAGRVHLWGRVETTAVRKRLELSAAGVVGVKALESHLAVEPGD